MGINDTPSSERVHISFFGKRNAGKSSVVNAVTGQDLAVVSDVKGTTTDPVYKSMELLPLGPVMIIDTPGIDDAGELGNLRIKKTYQILNKTDIAVLIIDASAGRTEQDDALIQRFTVKEIPYVIVYNKSDLTDSYPSAAKNEIWVSAKEKKNIEELKEMMARIKIDDESKKRLVSDLLEPSDFVILVVPIDKAAPKGRLILPQQQTIRDILEAGACAIALKENELTGALNSLGKKPKLVITDSQVFARVAEETPEDILLTSFSILFARYKGDLRLTIEGAKALNALENGDTVLICEGCTHHRQCDDIGTYKLPKWIKEYTGKELNYAFTSGTEFPDDLTPYKMAVHCGGCMLNDREMRYRQKCAHDQNTPITNYGVIIAYMNGILRRATKPFPELRGIFDEETKRN